MSRDFDMNDIARRENAATKPKKYTITETIAWTVEADSPAKALREFMDADPATQYAAFLWTLTDRYIEGPDPATGEVRGWESCDLAEEMEETE